MRISLLMQREPFDEILVATLKRFWQQNLNERLDVQWIWKPTHRHISTDSVDMLCNIHLNAIFPAGSNNGGLEPIRREFSRSVVPWRSPFQHAYCKLALSPRLAHWFKQAVLRISPPHDSLAHQIIVPGNHKIRVLERRNNCAYGVLKHGFSASRFQNEITSRQHAESLGIPVPKLLDTDVAGGWFQETYITGTPLNRISHARKVEAIATRACAELTKLADETTSETTVGEYVNLLTRQIATGCNQNHLLDEQQRRQLDAALGQLCSAVDEFRGRPILTAQTHGDFQPANVLVNNNDFWIIDWEYAARRQRAYDVLVFQCGIRQGHGLAKRLQRFVDVPPDGSLLRSNPAYANLENRRLSATVLLLEELDLRLAENANPHFMRVDDGLARLRAEIEFWIAEQ